MLHNEYFDNNEFRELLQKYEEARDSHSSIFLDEEDFNDLIDYYNINEKINQALEVADAALEIYPGATFPLSYKAKAAIYDERDIEKAQSFVELISEKNNVSYYTIFGELLLARGMAREADEYFEEKNLLSCDEEQELFYIDIAQLFLTYLEFDVCEKWLHRCENLKDEPEYLDIKSTLALMRGNYKESAEIVDLLIDKNPYDRTLWNRLASAQLLADDVESSIQSSDFSLAIMPNDWEALLNKANAFLKLENYDEALKLYQQALEQVEDPATAFNIKQQIVHLYLEKEDYDTAIEVLEASSNPDFVSEADTLIMKANILIVKDDIASAIDSYCKALWISKEQKVTFAKVAIINNTEATETIGYQVFRQYFAQHPDATIGWSYYCIWCRKTGLDKEEADFAERMARERNPKEAKEVLDSNVFNDNNLNIHNIKSL